MKTRSKTQGPVSSESESRLTSLRAWAFRKAPVALASGLVLGGWLVSVWEFWVPLTLLAIPWLVIRRADFACVLLLCSFFVVIPLHTVRRASFAYWNGEAKIMRAGLTAGGPAIERETRCEYGGSGCIIGPTDFLVNRVNNFTVRTWTRHYGVMEGAYTGPLPSVEEARALLGSRGQQFTSEQIARAPWLEVDGCEVPTYLLESAGAGESPNAFVLERRCLVLAGPKVLVFCDLDEREILEVYYDR